MRRSSDSRGGRGPDRPPAHGQAPRGARPHHHPRRRARVGRTNRGGGAGVARGQRGRRAPPHAPRPPPPPGPPPHAAAWARDETLLLGALGRQRDGQDFLLLPDKLATETIAIALRRDAGLQRVMDHTMALAVRSGKMDSLYEQWFVKPSPANPKGL